MNTKLECQTRKVELVETDNIARSLRRIANGPGYDRDSAKKRALYHAVCMTNSFGGQERANLRVALNLP